MALRYELWPLPTDTPYERIIADLPVPEGDGTGTVKFNDAGYGNLRLPANYDRLDELIDTDSYGRTVRVFDQDDLIHEWVAQRNRIVIKPDGFAYVTGPDSFALMGKSVIYPYDYDGVTYVTAHPDHIWGEHHNLLHNGDFQQGTNLVTNGDFEAGELAPFYAGAVDGYSATAVVSSANPDTGSFHARVTPLLSEGGMSQVAAGLFPEKTYTLSSRVAGTSGKTIQVGFSAPYVMGVGTADEVVEFTGFYEGTYEAHKDDVATGVYRTIAFDFVTAAEQTTGQVNIRDKSAIPAQFDADNITLTGYGVGMQGWSPTDIDAVTKFEAETVAPYGADTYHGTITAADGAGMFQEVADVNNGVTYTASIRARTSAGTARWVWEVTDEFGRRVAQESIVLTTTYQQFEITGELHDDLPGARELLVTLRNVSGGTSTIYTASGTLYEGEPEATTGTIILALHNDAAVDHAADPRGASLDWIDTSTITAILDSAAVGWDDKLKFIARASDDLLQQVKNLKKLGYEAELVAKTTPAAGKTHDLKMYNQFGLGADYLAAPTPSIYLGMDGMVAAEVVLRIPDYSSVIVFGSDGAYNEAQNAAMVGDFGIWETARRYSGSDDPSTIGEYASELVDSGQARDLKTAKVKLRVSTGHKRPLVHFPPGTFMVWQLPPWLPKEDRRVTQISYQNTDPDPTYDVVSIYHEAIVEE